jgi:two-component system phosphate regulon response regulator PhoB
MPTKGSVLIVSDDEDSLDILRQYFSNANYQIMTASSKDAALNMTRQRLPQAIIIDQDVLDLDVAALCAEVRASPRTRHIHITLLTPQSRQDERLQALMSLCPSPWMPKS